MTTAPDLPKEYEYQVITAASTAEAQAEFKRLYPGYTPERFFYWRGVYYFPMNWKRKEVKE
jgi:hypothetical protein